MKIKFTPSARRQFLEGLEYIRQDSLTAARRFRLKAETVQSRLSEFWELPDREVIVRPFLLFYRVVGKTVWIVAVWHSCSFIN